MSIPRILMLVLGFLVFSHATSTAFEQTTRQRIEVNREGRFFGIGGWSQKEYLAGEILYACRAKECVRGSTVSLHLQDHVGLSESDLLANEMKIKDAIIKSSKGEIKEVILDEPLVQTEHILRSGIVHRTIVPATDDTNVDINLFWTSGFVEMNGRTFMISSSAATLEMADKNFELFKFLAVHVLAAGGGKEWINIFDDS
jgi:hypothetical protein